MKLPKTYICNFCIVVSSSQVYILLTHLSVNRFKPVNVGSCESCRVSGSGKFTDGTVTSIVSILGAAIAAYCTLYTTLPWVPRVLGPEQGPRSHPGQSSLHFMRLLAQSPPNLCDQTTISLGGQGTHGRV